ncbi:MAG TPA: hypothetical protein GXZ90_02165 [Clostridiales bacterium]|nr:hypothetical protein [Clostridiales bacterium]
MTALEELKEYIYIDINKHVPMLQRSLFIINGENPIRDVSLLKLNVNQVYDMLGRNKKYDPINIKVGDSFKFFGIEVKVADNLNDNLFWTKFNTVKDNEFIGYLNIRYLEILLENVVKSRRMNNNENN